MHDAEAQVSRPMIAPVQHRAPTMLLAAIHSVMKNVGYVQKSGENEFHHYKYATEADTIKALRSEMLAQGLILTPSVFSPPKMDEHGNTHIIMAYTLHHVASGESMQIHIPASGNDRSSKGSVGDKGIYKAMTGALKYALRQTFMLETGDDPEVAREDEKNDGEKEHTHELLEFANKMIEMVGMQARLVDLQSLWTANIPGIDRLKAEHVDLWTKVRDAFAARKKLLQSNEGAK